MRLQRVFTVLFTVGLVIPSRTAAQAVLPGNWNFEAPGPGGRLVGWNGTAGQVFRDSVVVHRGRYAARLARPAADIPASGSAILARSLPADFSGTTIELRGWLKTDSVTGFAGLWLREDGGTPAIQFDNMMNRHLAGTTDWSEYRIQLPVDRRVRTIVLGALLVGNGTVWADDLELFVDGKPLDEAPPRPRTPVEQDTAFDAGSGIATEALSPVQVENLTLLGKVWGFAKYRHPRIVGGEVNWDYELFRVMPEVLKAEDRATAEQAMADWLQHLGDPAPCAPCATEPTDAYLMPDIAWIRDSSALGTELSRRLQLIEDRRSLARAQYYVSQARGAGNPDFSNEVAYRKMPVPDAGFRLLALYRFWNIIEYWYPNRDIIGEDWNAVLPEFLPRFLAANGRDDYRLVMLQLVARIHDTHANLWSDLSVRPPRGSAQLPVTVRFIEGKAVVTGYSQPTLGPATGLRVGDVIESLDGARVDSLVDAWRPYYADSNEAARLRDIARTLTRGPEGSVQVRGTRADGPFDVTARRVPMDSLDMRVGATHDLPGATFRMLTPEVAYLKLSSVKNAEMADYFQQAATAKVLVVDIRNYPSEFVVFSLGGRLVGVPTPFARFTQGDPVNPGAFEWTGPATLQPQLPHFDGKVVVLVDAVSQSQAEYTTMALRAAGAMVVGSTTAGADGDISAIPLPGGLQAMISGIGVFYPDRKPTQRVGIVPDVEVHPTIAGIRAGRDEVLEAAVSRALGRPFTLKR